MANTYYGISTYVAQPLLAVVQSMDSESSLLSAVCLWLCLMHVRTCMTMYMGSGVASFCGVFTTFEAKLREIVEASARCDEKTD